MQVDLRQVESRTQLVLCVEPAKDHTAGATTNVLEQRPVKDGLHVRRCHSQRMPQLSADKGRVRPMFHALCGSHSGAVREGAQQLRCAPGARCRAWRWAKCGCAAHRSSVAARGGDRSVVGHVKVARKWGNSPMPGVRTNVHACQHPPWECARRGSYTCGCWRPVSGRGSAQTVRTIKRTRWGKAVQPTVRPNGTVELMREREVPLAIARGERR